MYRLFPGTPRGGSRNFLFRGGWGGGGRTLVQTGSRIDTDRFPRRVPKAQASWGIRG